MSSKLVANYVAPAQDGLYNKLNHFSGSHRVLGRFAAIPVSVLDVTLEISKTPLAAIESIAAAAIHLVGAAFSAKCKLKDALTNLDIALSFTVAIPVKVALAPIKLIYQIFAGIINPEKVQSINYLKPTFKV